VQAITCMDTRLSYRALGLRPGDAHLVRNAGGIVTADALRSLLVSKYLLGTREIMIINHTDCGLMKATEEEIRRRIEKRQEFRRARRLRSTLFATSRRTYASR